MDIVRLASQERSYKAALAPLAVFLGLTFFVGISAYLFFLNENEYIAERSEMVAQTVATGLRSEIKSRIGMMTVLAEIPTDQLREENYESLARIAMDNFSAFYAINYVSPDGVIKKVFPREPNLLALGQKLFEKESVRTYLKASRDTQSAQMSHRIMTYQKIYAFVLYVPIFDQSNKFVGWINGVVDFDSWLLSYLASRNLTNTRVRIRWDESPDSMIDQGNAYEADFFTYTYQLLNQRVHIDVGFSRPPSEQLRNRFYLLMLVVGIILLGLIGYFYMRMMMVKNRLARANSQLFLKNSLLSSVTHDISNPLLALNLNLESVLQDESSTFTPLQKQKAIRSLKRMGEMLNGARRMHAQGMGLDVIGTQPVNLHESLHEALHGIHDYAESKPVKFDVEEFSSTIYVKAEPKTLINNVLTNVLTNAVKFSPLSGTVKITTAQDGEYIDLIIEDQGKGLSEAQIKQFQSAEFVASQFGTRSEPGTGLGLLQIRTFMDAYGGTLKIQNTISGGACMILRFTISSQPPAELGLNS